MTTETAAVVRTPDGLRLAATVVEPASTTEHAALLVHGGGVTRNEGGFFTRLAAGLADSGVASLRADLPGHGDSEGQQEDLSLTSLLNTIRAGLDHLRGRGHSRTNVVAASFSGGMAAIYAARTGVELHRLVLLNPLLDYRRRFVDDKPVWHGGHLDDVAGRELLDQGYLAHSPTFRLGRALLNEVFWFAPRLELADVQAPTLLVHGSGDTFIPVESSRDADRRLRCEHRLLEIEGAQHGFAVHDDPGYRDPQTQRWQRDVIAAVAAWLGPGD